MRRRKVLERDAVSILHVRNPDRNHRIRGRGTAGHADLRRPHEGWKEEVPQAATRWKG